MASLDDSSSVKSSSEESYEKECSPCEYDGVVKKAKYFCTECQEYMCQSCETLHKRFKGTKTHTVSLCGDTKTETKEDDCSTVACSCQRNDVDIYCKYHNEVFCSDCKIIKHRQCQTRPVDTFIADLDTSFDAEAIEYANEVKCMLENQVTKCKERLEQIDTDTNNQKEDVLLFADELKKKVDTLKESSIEELCRCSSLHKEVIDYHVSACNTALKTLSFEKSNQEKLKESRNKRQRFLSHVKLTQTLKDVCVLNEEMRTEKYEPILSFERNENLFSVLKAENLGIVTHNLKRQHCLFNADMTISSIQKMKIRIASDSTTPWITGSAFLPNGDLILCDKNNVSIKHFDSKFKYRETVGLSSAPRDCCSINKDEVLVTLPSERQIQRFQTVQTLQLKNILNLDKQCEGIDCLNQDIFVTCIDMIGKEIRIIDIEGNVKRKIVLNEVETDLNLRPFYVTVSNWGQIYVTESNIDINKTQIRCFEKYGACRYTLSRENLDGIGGMLVDDQGRLLACFWRSNTVQVISKDGTTCQKFLDSNDDNRMAGPYSISYRESDATLGLTLRDKNYMLLLNMK